MTWEPYDDVPEDKDSDIVCDMCGYPVKRNHGYRFVAGLFICDDCDALIREIA